MNEIEFDTQKMVIRGAVEALKVSVEFMKLTKGSHYCAAFGELPLAEKSLENILRVFPWAEHAFGPRDSFWYEMGDEESLALRIRVRGLASAILDETLPPTETL
jgi:hypothetical protein